MTAPTPVWDHDGIVLLRGDAHDVDWPDPQPGDLLLTDPPYGKDHDTGPHWDHVPIAGDDRPFDPTWLLERWPRAVLWGANWYAHLLPITPAWIVWDKRLEDSTRSGLRVPDGELAWTRGCGGALRIFRHLWAGPMRDEPFLHPMQKPVALMRWVITRWTEPGATIFDPYAGSGPVALAARDTGRCYLGCELEARWADVAVTRLAQAPLFTLEG